MSRKFTLAAFGLLYTLSAAVPAYAQDAAITPQTGAGGIEYVTGGIGDGQQQALKAMQSAYNLRLTFARKNGGNYLADVKVTVTGKGVNLDAMAQGPMLYAKLPAGTYEVTAEYGGQRQTQKVTLGAQGKALTMYFNE
jgi:hypothetical protein